VLSGPYLLPASGNAPKSVVVLLHGYGANGENLIDLAHEWGRFLPDTEFIAPNAPNRSEVNPLGYQWFGLADFSPLNMRAGLDSVRTVVRDFLMRILGERNLTPRNLCLVGFSQGTMLSLDLMFLLPGLKGIIGYSGAFYPPVAETLSAPLPEVLLVHGDSDTVVPYAAMGEAARQLALFGIHPTMHTCPALGHSINREGLIMGSDFLKHHLYGEK
jgi:phospholipase/carboxylesterase